MSGIDQYILQFLKWSQPFLSKVDRFGQDYISKLVSWSDPITVIITLFVILSPIALGYVTFAKMGFINMMQMQIKGKNILYVIAHPDDEAM